MIVRSIKPVLLIICVVGLIMLPMSDIFLHNVPMDNSIKDYMRVSSEKVEHTDYHSSDISTFVNDYFIFYVPPPTIQEEIRPTHWDGFEYRTQSTPVANMSSIQLFSYENGAEIEIEWLNGTALSGANFNYNEEQWELDDDAKMTWLENLPDPKSITRTLNLDEYESEEIQLNTWIVKNDFRMISGIVKITSDFPISVMHHKLHPMGTLDEDGYEMTNYNWDGIFSAYGEKLFTRITGDCWISALEADTTVNVWDYSDKNDDIKLSLDRFEGWAYTRNPIYEQYGFDDDLVLISADKPVSIVAGIQADQGFVQVFGKDGKDFLFPCFGKILIYAPTGATIDLDDKNGNQGSFKGSLDAGETKMFDFKVSYKLRQYSSYEWAHLISSEPVIVYSMATTEWYLDEDYSGMMSGEEYLTVYKKLTDYYPLGWVPYPASTEFSVPIYSRAYITVVNLDAGDNDVKIDYPQLHKPFKTKMDSYESVTLDLSEDSYYYMDLVVRDTGYKQPSEWTFSDPDNRYALNNIPHIAVDRGDEETVFLEWDNMTKGETLKITSKNPVMVLVNYNKDQKRYPQGIDLIPGLTPPIKRGLPDAPTMLVAISGMIIAADALLITVGRRSIVEVF